MSDDGPIEFTDIQMARASLILNLRQRGIVNRALLRAFEAVPHEAFVPDEFLEYAYRDRSLPIGFGQSITSPTIQAALLVALDAEEVGKVLEIGTGSGYSAALLSKLARRVFTLERVPELAHAATEAWRKVDCGNIVGFNQDGLFGLSAQAPFDRILLNGAVAEVSEDLLNQLSDDGVLVAAVGGPDEKQIVTRIERIDDDFIYSEHGYVRLSQLHGGKTVGL